MASGEIYGEAARIAPCLARMDARWGRATLIHSHSPLVLGPQSNERGHAERQARVHKRTATRLERKTETNSKLNSLSISFFSFRQKLLSHALACGGILPKNKKKQTL